MTVFETVKWKSVSQFSCSVMSDSLLPHGLQHARLPCPSSTPGAYSNSCLLHRWCHPTISSFVIPFSSRLQSFLASGSFPMSPFFASGGQSIGVSASTSVLPMNIQGWSSLGLTGLISLQSKGLARVFSNTTVQKHPAILMNKKYYHHQWFLVSKCEWRLPKLWSRGCCCQPLTLVIAEELG